jgi:hypothetical protein
MTKRQLKKNETVKMQRLGKICSKHYRKQRLTESDMKIVRRYIFPIFSKVFVNFITKSVADYLYEQKYGKREEFEEWIKKYLTSGYCNIADVKINGVPIDEL